MRDPLRQAKYGQVGKEVARFAQERFAATGQRCDLLDVGGWSGFSRRFIEIHDGAEHVNYHGASTFPNGLRAVYKSHDWTLSDCSLETGLVALESDAYDVVICERVVSQNHPIEMALCELARVLKPGGLTILGIPSHSTGLNWVSRYLRPVVGRVRSRLTGRQPNRDQIQRFSTRSLNRMIRRTTGLCRIRLKRFRTSPFRCSDVQFMATKKRASGPQRQPDSPWLPSSLARRHHAAFVATDRVA